MTIQAWLEGTPVQLRQAQQGIPTTYASGVSTTVSQVAATQLQTDFNILIQTGAAQAVKVLGGDDTSATPGPCHIADTMSVVNHTGQNVTIYPQTGGTIKNGAVNAGFLIATGLTAILTYLGSGNWAANAS
jgi:hypothetical protein